MRTCCCGALDNLCVQVRRIIEGDLGQSVEELYSQFDWTPIASASLAQVDFLGIIIGVYALCKLSVHPCMG